MLPPDIQLSSLTVARSPDFHAITHATEKLYTYRFATASSHDPFKRIYQTHVHHAVDLSALSSALAAFEGRRDFRAFAGQVEAKSRDMGVDCIDTVRTVRSVTLVSEGGGDYRIEVRLKGALYKMVRNMVGVALDVARGRYDPGHVRRLLNVDAEGEPVSGKKAPTRSENPSKPAPPQGLCLESVEYDQEAYERSLREYEMSVAMGVVGEGGAGGEVDGEGEEEEEEGEEEDEYIKR